MEKKIIELLNQQASQGAIEWALEMKVMSGRYPSGVAILNRRVEILSSLVSRVNKMEIGGE